MSDDTIEIGVAEDTNVSDAPLGSQENPMTREEAAAAGVDVDKVEAEAEPLPEESEKGPEEAPAPVE